PPCSAWASQLVPKVTGSAKTPVAEAVASAKAAAEIFKSLFIDVTLCFSARNPHAELTPCFSTQDTCHQPPSSGKRKEPVATPFSVHRAYFSGASPCCRKSMLPLDARCVAALRLRIEETPM